MSDCRVTWLKRATDQQLIAEVTRRSLYNEGTHMKPSNFTTFPYSSVLGKTEAETIAANIMVILKRTGDTFRSLEWEEYKEERLNDRNFSEREQPYFNAVIEHCASPNTAMKFSPAWKKAGDEL